MEDERVPFQEALEEDSGAGRRALEEREGAQQDIADQLSHLRPHDLLAVERAESVVKVRRINSLHRPARDDRQKSSESTVPRERDDQVNDAHATRGSLWRAEAAALL